MNIIVKKLILGSLATNCYFVSDPKTQKALIIDPADSGDYLTQKIQELNLKPMVIVATHGHFDHVLGSLELQLNFQIPFLIHQKDQKLIGNAAKSAQYWTRLKEKPLSPAQVNRFLNNKTILKIGQIKLQIIETPGHTPGSICLWCQKENLLFSGDTLFAKGVGRTDLSGGSQKELTKSLKKLFSLPDKTKVFPGHGPKTTISQERKNLPASYSPRSTSSK